jgi:hypothetical protein
LWDFDSDIATPASLRIDPQLWQSPSPWVNLPIRAYYQGAQLPANAPVGSTLIDISARHWSGYVEHPSGDDPEVPPLPPEGTNSNPGINPITGTPYNGSDTPGSIDVTYAHHLNRDFMFLDAAAANQEASNTSTQVQPQTQPQFTVSYFDLDPTSSDDPELPRFTRGTGHHLINNKYLINDGAVGNVIPDQSETSDTIFTLFFDADQSNPGLSFTILLYQLTDLSGNAIDGNQYSPNWFGVAVPDGITDFANVIIYFHPSPLQAGYFDTDYALKSNTGNSNQPIQNHTNWKELLGYVDRLASQLAGATKYANATPNQIVILPIMRSANVVDGEQVSYGPGVLTGQWYYIVNAILQDIPTRLSSL